MRPMSRRAHSAPLSERTPELELSLNASSLCRSLNHYSQWASSVRLDAKPRGDQKLPQVLSKMLIDSRTIPRWLTEEAAPQYDICRQDFERYIRELSCEAPKIPDVILDDASPSLSQNVHASLLPILGIVMREERLTAPPYPEATEADRRCSIDFLGLNVWEYQMGPDFQYRLECTLQLPKTQPMLVHDMKADSLVLIRLPEDTAFLLHGDIRGALSSLGPSSSVLQDEPPTRLVHWVIEYQRDETAEIAFRQVSLGLASSLYQRRAFGFDEHFVFGIAHHSKHNLDVFAATWEFVKDASESTPGVTELNPGKSQASAATLPQEGSPNKLSKAASNESKIIVYRLGTFSLFVPTDVLQFYLLLRSTRELAQQYREDIIKESRERIRSRKEQSPDIYSWPAPPRQRQGTEGSRSSTGGKKRKIEPGIPEEGEEDEPMGPVDEDTPIGFCHIQRLSEINPDDKVRDYLLGVVQDQVDMLPLD